MGALAVCKCSSAACSAMQRGAPAAHPAMAITRCVIAMAVFTVLSTGDALAEMPPLNSRALGDLLIQRGGIVDGHAAAALGVMLIQRNEEAAEDTDSITPSPAEENIIFAETKVDDDAFVTSNELVQSSSNELAALKSRLDVQVAKAKKKMKAGKGNKSAKKAAKLAKKVLKMAKKVKKERKAAQLKKKAKKAGKKKKKSSPKPHTSKAKEKMVSKDPISDRLSKARKNYRLREKKEQALVVADQKKVSSLKSEVATLTRKLAKANDSLKKSSMSLARHRELHAFDLKTYKRLRVKETHRKKMVWIKAAIRKQRARVRKEREEEEASREQLQKYEERKQSLVKYHAHKLSKLHDQSKGKSSAPSNGASAVSQAVRTVERSMEDAHLEAQLRPQVVHLKSKLSGAALHTAVRRLIQGVVAAKVDASLQKNETVRNAISRAVMRRRRKLGLPQVGGAGKIQAGVVKNMQADSGLAAKAKMEADAAVVKVQAARKSLNAANARLSRAVNAVGHKGVTFSELELIQVANELQDQFRLRGGDHGDIKP